MCIGHYQFTCIVYTAWSTEGGIIRQQIDGVMNALYDYLSRCWIISGDVASFIIQILQCFREPPNPHPASIY